MELSLANSLVVFTLILPLADRSPLDDIWAAWQERERRCSTVEIAYKSHMRSGAERRDNGQGIAIFGPNGRMYCKSEASFKGRADGTYTIEELVLSEVGIRSVGGTRNGKVMSTARLTDRHAAISHFSELSTAMQLFRPASIAPMDDYSIQPKSKIDGKTCHVIQRTEEVGGNLITVTLFLRESLDFLPVRRVVSARTPQGEEYIHMELKVSYDLIGENHIPKAWVLNESLRPDSANPTTKTISCLRTRVEVNADISDARFRIELQEGTKLSDLREESRSVEVLEEPRVYGSKD